MTEQQSHSDPWLPCPSGELANMVQQQKSNRKKARALNVARLSTAIVLLISVVTVFYVTRDNHYGGISCQEVREHAPDYMANKLADSPKLVKQIKTHLAQCTSCQKHLKQMKQSMASVHSDQARNRQSIASQKIPFHAISVSILAATPEARVAWHQQQWKDILQK